MWVLIMNVHLVPRLCDRRPLYSAAANMGDWEGIGGGAPKGEAESPRNSAPRPEAVQSQAGMQMSLGALEPGGAPLWGLLSLLPFLECGWGRVQGKNKTGDNRSAFPRAG